MGGDLDPFRELAYYTLLQQQQQSAASGIATSSTAVAPVAAVPTSGASEGGEDAQLIQQLGATRSYEDCKHLFSGITSRAASPAVLAAAALRFAVWGSREFKEQMFEQQQRPLQDAVLRNEQNIHGGPAPGRALSDGSRPFQRDERFLDFKQRIRLVLNQLLQHIRAAAPSLKGTSLADILCAASLSRLLPMESVRLIAAALIKELITLNPKDLVRVLHDYTRCMELEADAFGGINITTDDRDFTQRVLQQLYACADTAAHEVLSPGRETLKTLKPKEITLLLRSCDRLSLESPELMQHVGQLALKKQLNFTPDDWAVVVSVFSRMGIPLRGDCSKQKRPNAGRDWERPPPPKKPVPISQC